MVKNLIILIALFASFGLLFAGGVKAGPEHNVSGWAWSANIGWISFNSTNCDSNGDGITDTGKYAQCPVGKPIANYGVHIAPATGNFSGHAWSTHIGWIDFAPASPYPALPNYSACLDLPGPGQTCDGIGDYNVGGWARALAHGGGWDGWIKLRGTWTDPVIGDSGPYGVSISTTTGEFSGWAWGGDSGGPPEAVIGWISFNCADRGVCGTSNYKVMTVFNRPPTANNLQHNIQYCNIRKETGMVSFSWKYQDPENTNQSAYSIEVQQLIGGAWQSKVLCENISTVSPPSGGIGTSAVLIKSTPTAQLCDRPAYIGDINYGRSTRWRVNVRDGDGHWSGWTSWTTSFPIDPHAHPWIEFDWAPEGPTVNEVVQFTDRSTVYGGTSKSSWSWTFQNGNPSTSNIQNPTTTFAAIQPGGKGNEVTLQVCDTTPLAQGGPFCCSGSKYVSVTLPLPEYREVPPIIWLRNFLAMVSSFFRF